MRNLTFTSARSVLVATALFAGVSHTRADSRDDEIKLLREQLQQLDQKLRILERKQEVRDEATAAAAPTTPRITASDKGFTIASPDSANSIKLRGLAQLDSRLFFGDGGGVSNNGFVLRRARIITEGQFARNYGFQFVTEFGGSAVSILDANLTIAADKSLQVKFGKFKVPVGHELLQSDSWTFFNERSIVTNLVPNRDLGVQVSGDVLDGTLNYAAGIFNGVGDGGSSSNADFDDEKDLAARVFFSPFKNTAGSPLQGFALGISGSIGREKTVAGRTSGYRTDGQQTFFSYLASTITDGQNWRVSPHVDFRQGPLGVIGEYVVSAVNVRPGATGAKTELQNKGWQLAAGYVVTGEDSSFSGVVPRTNFDRAAGTWGAFEITGRVANLKVDDAAFPTFASAASNADEATSFGLGLNWYLSKAVAFKLDYYQTMFDFSPLAPAVPTTPVLRQDEKTFISRFQLAF